MEATGISIKCGLVFILFTFHFPSFLANFCITHYNQNETSTWKCQNASNCCDVVKVATQETKDHVKEALEKHFLSLSKMFEFSYRKLDKTVIQMLNNSKHELHDYLLQVYGPPYELMSDCLFELFHSLEFYYTAKIPPSLLKIFDVFFEQLTSRLMFLFLHDFDLTPEKNECVKNYTLKHKFFDNTPQTLASQIKTSFLLLRTFSSFLKSTHQLIKNIQEMVLNHLCSNTEFIENISNCSFCPLFHLSPSPLSSNSHHCCAYDDSPSSTLHHHLHLFTPLYIQWTTFIGMLQKVATCFLHECHLSNTVKLMDESLSSAMTAFKHNFETKLSHMIKYCGIVASNYRLPKRSIQPLKQPSLQPPSSFHQSSSPYHPPSQKRPFLQPPNQHRKGRQAPTFTWSDNRFEDIMNEIRVDVKGASNFLTTSLQQACIHGVVPSAHHNACLFQPSHNASTDTSITEHHYHEKATMLNSTMLQRVVGMLNNFSNRLRRLLIFNEPIGKNTNNNTINISFGHSSGYDDEDDDEDDEEGSDYDGYNYDDKPFSDDGEEYYVDDEDSGDDDDYLEEVGYDSYLFPDRFYIDVDYHPPSTTPPSHALPNRVSIMLLYSISIIYLIKELY